MKIKQIRRGIFETNSSSTHSICVAHGNVELIVPRRLHFEFGEFGWGHDRLQDVEEKASYLYTGLINMDRDNEFDTIVQWLKLEGIGVTYEVKHSGFWDYGYIDHCHDLDEFLDAVCDNKNELINFLFSPLSFIITGNDNCDIDVDIDVDYPHTLYYKGN